MIKVFLLVVCLCIPILAFSEKEETLIPYISQSDSTDVEAKIEQEIVLFKGKYSDYFTRYEVLRKGDISLCGGNNGCEKIVEGDLISRYWAEGRCAEIKHLESREICEGIKGNNCSKLSGWKAQFCKAFLENDINELTRVVDSAEFKNNVRSNLSSIEQTQQVQRKLAIFSGFKQRSPLPCQSILASSAFSLVDRMVCPYVFSSDSNNKDAIFRDFAILALAKKENTTQYCDLIKMELIKQECLKNK